MTIDNKKELVTARYCQMYQTSYIVAKVIFPCRMASLALSDLNLSLALMTSFSWNSSASERLCNSLELPVT